jgi:hypothetical protein
LLYDATVCDSVYGNRYHVSYQAPYLLPTRAILPAGHLFIIKLGLVPHWTPPGHLKHKIRMDLQAS